MKVRVLITAVGSTNGINVINGLRKGFDEELFSEQLGITELILIGTDNNPISAGFNLVDRGYVVPKANRPEFFEKLLEITKKESIDVILPINSHEIRYFSRNKSSFEEKSGLKLIIPDENMLRITDDKYYFFKFLVENNVKTAQTHIINRDFIRILNSNPISSEPSSESLYIHDLTFPQIVKMREGSGSKLVEKIDSKTDLIEHLDKLDEEYIDSEMFIIQKFIKGREFTIDFTTGLNGEFIGAVIRERIDVRDGKSIKARSFYSSEILSLIKNVIKSLKYIGSGNLQGILTAEGEFYLIEFNPRFAAGGLPLTIHLGLNIPYILLALSLDKSIDIPLFDEYPSDIYMCRYYTEVFMEK